MFVIILLWKLVVLFASVSQWSWKQPSNILVSQQTLKKVSINKSPCLVCFQLYSFLDLRTLFDPTKSFCRLACPRYCRSFILNSRIVCNRNTFESHNEFVGEDRICKKCSGCRGNDNVRDDRVSSVWYLQENMKNMTNVHIICTQISSTFGTNKLVSATAEFRYNQNQKTLILLL